MTPIVDHSVSKNSLAGRTVVTLKPRDVVAGDTTPAKLIAEFLPGVPFVVEDVQLFAGAVAAGVDIDVLIGSTSVLVAVIADPTAATRVQPALSAAAALGGTATDLIKVTGLSDGSGTLADIEVFITLTGPGAPV